VSDEVQVRPASADDVPQVAALAAALVRMHHETDPDRFLIVDDLEAGYGRFLSGEIRRTGAVVLVAGRGTHVSGYAYGTLDGRDWKVLLDVHGTIQDIFVAEAERGRGIGRALLGETIAALTTLGAPRLVLSTMAGNVAAQRLFRAAGFRPTLLEMTR
jgi:ribosomal protein S18 acetylase RimI-like enzyme